jgi:hypothetical protein
LSSAKEGWMGIGFTHSTDKRLFQISGGRRIPPGKWSSQPLRIKKES